jgi:hypothetical protein
MATLPREEWQADALAQLSEGFCALCKSQFKVRTADDDEPRCATGYPVERVRAEIEHGPFSAPSAAISPEAATEFITSGSSIPIPEEMNVWLKDFYSTRFVVMNTNELIITSVT